LLAVRYTADGYAMPVYYSL